jgi:hypothetical protein
MTATRQRYLVRRVVASMVVSLVIGAGLVRAFAGGGTPAPSDRAASFVPRNALVYLNLASDQHSGQWKRMLTAANKLPTLAGFREALLSAAEGDGKLSGVDLKRSVSPWLGNEAAFAVLPGGSSRLLVLKVRNRRKAQQAVDLMPARAVETYRGVRLRDLGDGELVGIDRGFVLAGDGGAVHAGVDAGAGGSALGSDKTYRELRGGLPHARLVTGYLSQDWIRAHFAGPAALLSGAAHVSAIQSAAVSFGAGPKRLELALRGRPGPGAAQGCTPPKTKTSDKDLLAMAPAHPAMLLGISGLQCVLSDVIASPTSGLGKTLRTFAAAAQQSGVNVASELLPLFAGNSALSVEPGASAPTVTLDVAGVDGAKAMDVLGRLQPALVSLFQRDDQGSTPDISSNSVDGVNVLTSSLTPGLQLNYGAFGGNLVVSTDAGAIGAARMGQHLDQTGDFKTVLRDRPKSTSALVFFDLEKLLALADQAGLSSNPTYSAVRDDLQKIGAAGIVLAREGKDIDAELRLKNP